MSLLSVLFDNLQGLAVCEYSYEYQEYNTLDELHHLCGKAHHRQTTVQDDVQKRTNDCLLPLCRDISRHFDCSILMLSYQTFMTVCLSLEEDFYFFFFTIARID